MSSTAPRTTAPAAAASGPSGSAGASTPIAATADRSAGSALRSAAPAILYSFRRCPYAIRARLGLAAAGVRPGIDLELREVALRSKPPELLVASAKGTVPVLALPATTTRPAAVLEESLAILHWALAQRDPEGWLLGWSAAEQARMEELIATNDGPFKRHLDRFKYAGRHGAEGLAEQQEHRERGLAILRDWDRQLRSGGWLLGVRPSLADIALLPFVRQFRLADPAGFDAEPRLEALQAWLQRFLASEALQAVMQEPWASRSPWRSPSWLYHLALTEEWRAAQAAGVYRRSTRGMDLEQVGFLHASYAHQIDGTHARFYADLPAGAVRLLTIDPARLQEAGVDVLAEPAPESGELFPHLYGALPTDAVLRDEPYPP